MRDADDPNEDPNYRAGVLIGRRHSVTDIRERLRLRISRSPQAVVAAITEWCAQTEQELDDELQLVIQAHRTREGGT